MIKIFISNLFQFAAGPATHADEAGEVETREGLVTLGLNGD